MQYKNKQPSGTPPKKYLLFAALTALLIVGGAVYGIYFSKEENTDPTLHQAEDSSSMERSEKQSHNDKVPPEDTQGDIQGDDEQIQRNPSYQPPEGGNVTITRIEASASTVTVAALVQGINSGNCHATYQNSGSNVTGSAPIQQGPSYFACQIDIPRSQFLSGGNWSVLLRATDGNIQTTATGEVTL